MACEPVFRTVFQDSSQVLLPCGRLVLSDFLYFGFELSARLEFSLISWSCLPVARITVVCLAGLCFEGHFSHSTCPQLQFIATAVLFAPFPRERDMLAI